MFEEIAASGFDKVRDNFDIAGYLVGCSSIVTSIVTRDRENGLVNAPTQLVGRV